MFPDAVRLRRLLDYLSIKPLVDLAAMDEIQVVDPGAGNKLTQESLNKIDHIRKAVYSGNNYNQIGLFQFLIGLLFLEYGWFSEAAESFGRAVSQWSYLPERPNICLANFAKGVAYHRGRRFDLAKQIYSEVEQQIIRIRNEVSGPTSIPQIKKYQAFENDLSAQLKEAQKTVTRDIFHDLSPRIHPSLQTDAQMSMATQYLEVDPDILKANIERNLNLVELRSLCLRMNIDYHGLNGQGLANKARELVAYCTRHQRLPEFFKELSRRNPSVLWEENTLQPEGGDFVDGEVVIADSEMDEVVEALFEEPETAEQGTPFYRTPRGNVLFEWEDEGTQRGSYRMVVVNVDLSGNFKEFSLEQQEQFIHFISRITAINPNQVTILEVADGSIKVTVEMPDESARQLIDMLLENDPILKNFRILNIALGENVGRRGSAPPIVNVSPRQLEQVTPQILRQFIFLYFNDNQLRDLYFEMDVDYDSLPGRGKRDKAREIVAFCNRQKKFDRLVELCQKKRPKAFSEAFLMSETKN